jgi:DNA (cytosine-5)-methyltransferase 1
MNELALFAGAGGGLLATQILGFRTVCAVELDWYCRCVLTQRQNDGHFRTPFPIWDDIRTFDGRPWRGIVDVVTGGFPCQAFSKAAHGRNIAEKNLWHEMRRVVSDVSPRFVFAENVSRVAIDQAADDLEQMGYKTKAISLSAADLGADHIRERYWLLAYTDNESKLFLSKYAKAQRMSEFCNSVWETYTGELRVSDGLAYRMDRFKALGNGQVPIVAASAWYTLSSLII